MGARIASAWRLAPCVMLPCGWSITGSSGKNNLARWTAICRRQQKRSTTLMTPPGPENPTTLVLRRTFAAARARVFRAWIEPDALERWLKPRGQSMNVRELDARVGGSFQFELENG